MSVATSCSITRRATAGERRPDVLVAFDVPKEPRRDNYLVWKEGKAPDVVVEITSKSTKQKDKKKKFEIYRDILRVSEYFLFDPTEDYLDPPLQGFRLMGKEVCFDRADRRSAAQPGYWAFIWSATELKLRLVRSRYGRALTDAVERERRPSTAPTRNAAAPACNAASRKPRKTGLADEIERLRRGSRPSKRQMTFATPNLFFDG